MGIYIMDRDDNSTRGDKKDKASKVIKPKQFNKPGRAIPKKKSTPTDDLSAHANPQLVDPGIDPNEPITPEEMEEINSIGDNKVFTERELKLIELFFQYPTLPKAQLAIMADYKAKSAKALATIARMIISKLDSVRHHKEIFREIGFGEVQIALRLKQLAMQEANLTVALNATAQASKCMEMQKGDVDPADGFGVTVTRPSEQAKPEATGPQRKAVQDGPKKEISR